MPGRNSRGGTRRDGQCPNAACQYDYTVSELVGPKRHRDPYMERDCLYYWCPKCKQRLVFYEREKRVMGVGWAKA